MGWQFAEPATDEASYFGRKSTSRIDHALVSRRFVIHSAKYVSDFSPHGRVSHGPDALSDHAAVVVNVMLPPKGNR
jgi:endonuclease/exonuclease/phosphatase family metal-dependent hydrolase